MKPSVHSLIAIACGGTGGHIFPGLAIAEELTAAGQEVLLLTSTKEIDRHALRGALGMDTVALPATAFQGRARAAFLFRLLQSFVRSCSLFAARRPRAVLGMGGYSCAAPLLAARALRIKSFLHEANTVPGRANRWLAPWVDEFFVGFPQTACGLRTRAITVSGTPVRPVFQKLDTAACRRALDLDIARPVLLVVGGSQGASALNQRLVLALPELARRLPGLQYLHLSGFADYEGVRQAYQRHALKASVRPFLQEMEFALGAATLAVSRAGGSSLAEFAAMQVPALLIPYPAAADRHQHHNAQAFADTGAARFLDQGAATPEALAALILELITTPATLEAMGRALDRWHTPEAARVISRHILLAIDGRKAPTGDSLRGGARAGGLRKKSPPPEATTGEPLPASLV